jgi:putative membrane protein
MTLSDLPFINAILNSLSALFVSIGFVAIRRKHVRLHSVCMCAAVLISTLFLASYLFYHYHAGSTPFPGRGVVRVIYAAILISHSVLAALVPPLVLTVLIRAFRGEFSKHKRLARWTLPVWFYVSVTGVVIYVMLNY